MNEKPAAKKKTVQAKRSRAQVKTGITVGLLLIAGVIGIVAFRAVNPADEPQQANAGPGDVVTHLFRAYRERDSNKINRLMSEQGRANAAVYCSGAAINCLTANYPTNKIGELAGQNVEVIVETKHMATVLLRTQWTEQGERCQEFQMDYTEEGWQITLFLPPESCVTQ